MTEEQFWSVIEQSRRGVVECETQADELERLLTDLPAEEIVAFESIFNQKRVAAYRWDLWGVAYIANGGCSDDGFEYFRWWLIGQGRQAYENALNNPDSIADLLSGEEEYVECEEILYAVSRAYEQATGQQMPHAKIDFPDSPRGEPWEEDELASRFPKVAKKFDW